MGIERIIDGDTLILRADTEGEILRIRESADEQTAKIELSGKLSNEVVHDVEDELVAMSLVCGKVIIDLKDVSYISNAAIKSILELQHLVDAKQGELIMRNLSDEVYGTFEDMGIEDVFMIE